MGELVLGYIYRVKDSNQETSFSWELSLKCKLYSLKHYQTVIHITLGELIEHLFRILALLV